MEVVEKDRTGTPICPPQAATVVAVSLKRVSPNAIGSKPVRLTRTSVALDDHAKDILRAVLAEIETLPELGAVFQDAARRRLDDVRELGILCRPSV